MFPQSAPTTYDEVNAFMVAHGAGTRVRVPKTWATADGAGDEREIPAQMRYFLQACPEYGIFADYRLGEMARHGAPVYHPLWFEALRKDVQAYLAITGRDAINGNQVHDAFRLMQEIGTAIVHRGYRRRDSALTIMLYTINVVRHESSYSAEKTFLDRMADYAHLATLPDLTVQQKVDAALREFNRAALDDLLSTGVPYTLIREMFPRGDLL